MADMMPSSSMDEPPSARATQNLKRSVQAAFDGIILLHYFLESFLIQSSFTSYIMMH